MPVECKSLKPSFPLVVLQIPRTDKEDYIEIVVHRELFSSNSYTVRNARVGGSSYQYGSPVGKAMTQVGRSNGNLTGGRDTEVFDRWSQAVSSAHDLILCAVTDRRKKQFCHTVILPTLVVSNGAL